MGLSQKQIKVSIIIPTYRRDESLKQALLSAVNQSHSPIEVIVIDDNACENWNKKVKEIVYEVSRLCPIKYIQNSCNLGSAGTKNVGIWASSGDYITFLDDDDFYTPEKVSSQVQHMVEVGSDYSITDLWLYDEDNKLVGKRIRKNIAQYNNEDLLRYHLLHHITGTDTLMFKRSFILDIGGFPPIDVGDEFYLIQKAIEAGGKFSYLPVCHVKACVHVKTEGLSYGKSKIDGENELYKHKKRYFHKLAAKDRRFIRMRHFTVLAYAALRSRKVWSFFANAFLSFISSPFQFIKLHYSLVTRSTYE